MVPRIKTTLILFLILFFNFSPGTVESFNNCARSTCSLHEEDGDIRGNSRRLLSHDVVDYDDAGANTKHDPRGRRGGGKNG